MARRKQFDVDDALDKAMTLFWNLGYERTSLDKLLGAMGIGRASFYNAFGDKHSLFMQVLARYQKHYNQRVIINTLTEHPNVEGIQSVFNQVIESIVSDSDRKGCLLVNSVAEIAPHDSDVANFVQDVAQNSENAFYDALRNAQASGDIDPKQDCRAMARFLMAAIRGLRLTGRATNDRRVFDDIASVTLSTLDV